MRTVYTGKEIKKDFPHDHIATKNGEALEDNKLYICISQNLETKKDSSGCSVIDMRFEEVQLSDETIEFVAL